MVPSVSHQDPPQQPELVSSFQSFTSLLSRVWESVKTFFFSIALALGRAFRLLWSQFFREREVEILGCVLPETKAHQEGVLHAAVEWLAKECIKMAIPYLEELLAKGRLSEADICWDDRMLFTAVETFCRTLRKLGVRDINIWEVQKAVLFEIEIQVGQENQGDTYLLLPLFEQRVPDSKGVCFTKYLLRLLSKAWVAQFPVHSSKKRAITLAIRAISAEKSKEGAVQKILESALLNCEAPPRSTLFSPLSAKEVRIKDPERLFTAIGAHLKITRTEFFEDFWRVEQIWERKQGRKQFAKLLAQVTRPPKTT